MLDCVAVPSSRKGMHLALFRCSPYVSLCSSVFLTQLSQGPVTPLRPPPQQGHSLHITQGPATQQSGDLGGRTSKHCPKILGTGGEEAPKGC